MISKIRIILLRIYWLAKRAKFRHLRLPPLTLFAILWRHLSNGTLDATKKDDSWVQNPPSISVLITVYNQTPEEILRAIESVRKQEIRDLPVLILNDGSTNSKTIQFLNQFKLLPSEKIYSQVNQGVVSARNFLVTKCKTDYLIFLDPDDHLMKNYLKAAIQLTTNRRQMEIVYPDVLVHDIKTDSYQDWITGPFDPDVLVQTNTIPMSSVISTKLMRMLGGYSPAFESGVEDWDLFYRASLSQAIAEHLPTFGYTYTKARVSRTTSAIDNSDLIKLRRFGPALNFPFSMKRQVDVFFILPNLPRIGGVEKYVKILKEDLADQGLNVAFIVTDSEAFGYVDDVNNFRTAGNIVLNRKDFSNDENFIEALRILRANQSIAINFGSPWAFSNVKNFNSLFSKNTCFVFNTEISLKRSLTWSSYFDEFWLAYQSISDGFPRQLQKIAHTMYTGVIEGTKTKVNQNSEPRFTIGFLGRLSPEKNPLGFLEIASYALDLPGISFVMGGEGPLQEKVEAESLKLKNVNFVGYVDDAFSFLQKVNCLVITSFIEGIPLVAMEALSMGIPILSTDVGGISELLESESNGYLWNGAPKEAIPLLLEIRNRMNTDIASPELNPKFWRSNTSQGLYARIQVLLTAEENVS